jgi:hypothetical protein
MTDPTVNEKREPFCRAIETTSLMKELEKLRSSEEITYEELSKIAMGNCAPTGIKKGFLKSARDILFKTKGIEFKAIPNVGLQRMSDEDKMDKSQKTLPSYQRKVRKDMHRLTSIEFNKLSTSKQLEWNIQMTATNVLKVFSSGDGVAVITKEIANNSNPDKLALEETLKLFI